MSGIAQRGRSRDEFYLNPKEGIQSLERYVLSDRTLCDLGLEVPFHSARQGLENKRSPFLEFDEASRDCLRILWHRMRHLISNQTELNKKRAPIIGLFAILNKDPEGPQSGAETLLKLLNTFTRAAKNFNRELRTAREKIYPLSKATVRCRRSIYATFKAKDGEVYREHWAPYPIHARPLLELIRAVKILQSISKLLGSSNDATLQSLAKKIDIKLDTPGLKPITESELINSWPQDILNPYLAVDREDFRRKSEEWRLNGFGKSYKKAYFGYWC